MLKKIAILIAIGSIHFGLCMGIIPLTMTAAAGSTWQDRAPQIVIRMLVGLNRILFFPIISLSLYSRQWFPGNWIYVPMAANSLLWALGIYLLVAVGRKLYSGGTQT